MEIQSLENVYMKSILMPPLKNKNHEDIEEKVSTNEEQIGDLDYWIEVFH
jgi:hypothetical protein